MYKEILISAIIIIMIFISDIITQKNTKNTTKYLIDELNLLKTELKEEKNNDIDNRLNNIEKYIYSEHKKLAYYIEHDEIEKIETNFTACKSFIETKNYNFAISELERTIYVLEHITDKYSFSLENIF